MKQFLFTIFCIVSVSATSQNFEDSWIGYFSYVSVTGIVQGNDKIYAAAENAVFSYDLSTQEIETLSTINGLSGETISSIHYSEAFNLLAIGYQNGLIEIVVTGEEEILTVVDILDKPTIPPDQKRINHFNEYDGNLYIATDFGISVYNLSLLEFGDSFFIGDLGNRLKITQTTVLEPYIYAATVGGGVRIAMVEDENIIDYEQWTTISTGSYNGIQVLENEIYATSTSRVIYRFDSNGIAATLGTFPEAIRSFTVTEDVLTITGPTIARSFSSGFTQIAEISSLTDLEYQLQYGITYQDHFYLGTTALGMLKVPFQSTVAEVIIPEGPIRNDPFAIDASPGQLWVVYGDVTRDFNPFPVSRRGVSNLKEGMWTNIRYEELFEATDLVDVVINPTNPDEVFMTSFQKGLLKIVEQTPTILYNETNTGVLDIPGGNPDVGIRLYGADFDQQGNLWVVQSRTNDGLIKLTPGGQFTEVDISSIVIGEEELALTDVQVSREGFVFFGAVRNGLVGYNPSSGQFHILRDEIGDGNLPTNNVRALEFDNNNRLWIGTLSGLRVLFNVGGFFEENANTESQAIIFLDDGVPQELLFQQSITAIEADGSNNKWLATADSGVFYVSPNGQETLLQFNTDNSPLPSNNVTSVAIDPVLGTVYFATIQGLVAYKGTSTAPQETLENVYAFPNPVRPGFAGNVTIDGLTAKANIKITDIEGNLVFETTSVGGSVLWDTTAFGRYKVASGVYLVLITTEDAIETKVSKIMIIR